MKMPSPIRSALLATVATSSRFMAIKRTGALNLYPIVILLFLTICNLLYKIEPPLIARGHGVHYADYASRLVNIDPKIAYNWLSPWIAHQLGVSSHFGWFLFLYAMFLGAVVSLYLAALRFTHDRLFSVLLALIPVTSTSAWFWGVPHSSTVFGPE